MADTIQFDLVSPERRLASVQALEVRIPGAEGDLTAMPGHAPLITTLRPGVLTVVSETGSAEYTVTGGFAEINAGSVTVLAERGLPSAEVSPAIYAEMLAEIRAAAAVAAPGSPADTAAKLVADMEALGAQIGQ
ncbi:F0F1 ATP synthase subunit epsilon [Rhodobacter veldkampii DSM 11550]|uniref:ATP synthase epsilon chain n=1 Tax=Phaeovulum veldkampii DSM 11550 TaxID=1185920 RepID=A0A2T4JFM4_9RHOB|nr:F0F1 ATP synthase subunit epsilon [Phaeovulum veldkampii]MBK5945303.1 F0F1 ATP synthase subunit epsilon [Phaeovulum veldkampii DSM 11550]NCU21463.1 F0F1 ATP synthase subunit epsilon [Candidatus Falkowbacteria bacterium]PTE16710.1 F0F1 ATP synthase subunit epsilon [Phaeovulum veldkampii DSM 11550]TDQ60297.1 ATP synthase F1 subcomplex epsilon subunit [Phaeovulum veldkampii DSM 11550]